MFSNLSEAYLPIDDPPHLPNLPNSTKGGKEPSWDAAAKMESTVPNSTERTVILRGFSRRTGSSQRNMAAERPFQKSPGHQALRNHALTSSCIYIYICFFYLPIYIAYILHIAYTLSWMKSSARDTWTTKRIPNPGPKPSKVLGGNTYCMCSVEMSLHSHFFRPRSIAASFLRKNEVTSSASAPVWIGWCQCSESDQWPMGAGWYKRVQVPCYSTPKENIG